MKPLAWLALLAVVSCGGSARPAAATAAPGGTKDQTQWPADDRSMCERFVHWKGSPDLEVVETVGEGSFRPNIRRVYKVVGQGEDRHQILQCREIDTNLDGIKDVVRTFNDKGEAMHEEADTNYDGLLDDWINFADGRIEEEDVDSTLSAGRPNVWKFYLDGKLSRIRRNTHCPSGKPDVWEIYLNGRLDRVGNDTTCDGHVDRWDRDALMVAQEEAAAGVEIAEAGAPPAASAGAATDSFSGVTVAPADAGASAAKKKKGKK